MVRVGFTGRAYECAPDGPRGVYLPEGDISRPENQHELAGQIDKGTIFQLHSSPSCGGWTPFGILNGTTRSLDLPRGDGTLEREVEGNRLVAISIWVVIRWILGGVFFTMEHPLPSRLWRLPLMQFIRSLVGIFSWNLISVLS